MIQLSLAEIRNLSKHATRGVGFSWGIAEEVTWQVHYLEQFGLPGFQELSKLLDLDQQNLINQAKKLSCCRQSKEILSTFICGICLLDQGLKKTCDQPIILEKILAPIFLIPTLRYYAEVDSKQYRISWQDCQLIVESNCLYQWGKNLCPKQAVQVEIDLQASKQRKKSQLRKKMQPFPVEKKIYQKMQQLAQQIYVPSDQISQKDAG